MSLLTKFVRMHFLDAIEEEFIEALPSAKEIMVRELHDFACAVLQWSELKLNNKTGDSEHG